MHDSEKRTPGDLQVLFSWLCAALDKTQNCGYALPCPGTVAVPLCDMPKRGGASFEFPALLLRGETVPDDPEDR